jgi:hypothetical protein
MAETINISVELTHFQFPEGVKDRLNSLLDRQEAGEILSQSERHEAEGLVELAEFFSLLCLRSQHATR